MKHNPESFRLEQFLAKREFAAKYLFCCSDLESRTISEVLGMLTEHDREAFFNLPLSYTTTEGHEELRLEISKTYESLGPDQILCTAGAEEAIYMAARCFLSEKDHAIAITPCYQSLQSVAASICEVSEVELDINEGLWDLDISKIESEIREDTKILFLNFPHNPTGYIPQKETFLQILSLAQKHGLIVFSDEVYREMELNPLNRLPAACDVYENAVSLGVMSKSYGFAGLRIGWVGTQNQKLLNKMSEYKHYLSICNSAPSEWLATAILKNREKILMKNHQMLTKNHQMVRDYFMSAPDLFQWIEPQGGCTAYPGYLGKGKIAEIGDDLLHKKGVLIMPDEVYGHNSQHFRVSFGRKNCELALKEFSEFFADPSFGACN